MAEGKKIIGFRRVRGRVIPITTAQQVAIHAGTSAIVVGATGHFLKKSARKSFNDARAAHQGLLNGRKMVEDVASKLHHDKLLKDMATGDYLMSRNSVVSMRKKFGQNIANNKRFARMAADQVRGASKWKAAAIGLGVLSLGAMAYQKVKNAKR